MITANWFLNNNNYFNLNINHCDYGNLDQRLLSHDIVPYNRLFILPSIFSCKNSYICNRKKPDDKYMLEPGQLYYIPANYDLEYAFLKEMKIVGIHFSLEFYSGLDIFSHESEIKKFPDKTGAGEMIWQELQKNDSIAKVVCIRGMLLSLTGLLIDRSIEDMKRMMKIREKYGALFDWIKGNIKAGISINDLAEKLGISRDALAKGFSRDLGYPLKHFLNQELIKEASGRLLFSDRKIKDIALDLNFNDEYYFSRFFSKQTGLSPGEYRKRYRRKNNDFLQRPKY